jgi:predicted O-methyltransferase YrrM
MTLCDPKFAAVLSDYNDRLTREAKIIHDPEALKTIDVNDFLIPVGEEVGRLMHSLVVGLNARIIVELGTSYGDALAYQRAVGAIPEDAGDAAPCG